MAIEIIDGFEVFNTVPIDKRRTVSDISERDSINVNVRYDGLKTYVESEQKEYQLQGGTDNINWVDVTGGGGVSRTITLVTGSTYTATTDENILCLVSGTTLDVYLPENPSTGAEFVVKDSFGDAALNNIFIRTLNDTLNIDGHSYDKLIQNYESVTYVFNGIEYIII